MFSVDMQTIEPVGEFGSQAWCRAVADFGVKILQANEFPDDLCWGFSEIYTCPPDRLIGDHWPQSGYHFMIKNGEISGGIGVTQECLALSGFHVKMRWAYICNQSATKYGSVGQRQRSVEEGILKDEMTAYLGVAPDLGGIDNPVWPQSIIAALSAGTEEGAGLHNIAASLQSPSPEFSGLPTTSLGVPIFSKMSDEQKIDFLTLCAVEQD